MSYTIRHIKQQEYQLLDTFLYEAIFLPEGTPQPPRDIILRDELQVYVKNFGSLPDDHCFVAETNDEVVGAVWVRIMNDYGHVDDETPSLAVSLLKEYRKQGIGTALMKTMIEHLRNEGYKQISLSVDKANYAARMYLKLGFAITKENQEDYIMVMKL